MLDKILSAGAASQDYADKLRRFTKSVSREKFIRGLGVLVILSALFLQVFAAMTPHKTLAAASQNDLIPGGVSSQSELVKACQKNTNHIDKILDYYGISCGDLSKGDVVSINSRDYNDRLHSVGHLAYGFASETPVNIGGETIYWRLLHAWDTHGSSTYTALKFKSSTGQIFWMLFSCGNLVHVNVPKQPPPPPQPCPYNSAILATNPKCKPPNPCPYNPAIPATSPQCKPPTPCPYNPSILASNPECKPCANSTSQVDELACLTYHKSVTNVTQRISDANNTTAKPGDVLQYKLIVANTGKLKAQGYIIQDNISDILLYADLTDAGGGSLKNDGFLSYPATDIAPDASVTKTFTVTVKNPLPTTPPSINDPQAYNDVMTNVFGDTINVKVQPPTAQVVVASATTQLPNTGPGTTMIAYALLATVAGYFYSNRRLQLKEAKLALVQAGDAQEVA